MSADTIRSDTELLEFMMAYWETQTFGEELGWRTVPLDRKALNDFIDENPCPE